MKLDVDSLVEHQVHPKPTHVSNQDSQFQAVLPGASSFGSCSCGALSSNSLTEEV